MDIPKLIIDYITTVVCFAVSLPFISAFKAATDFTLTETILLVIWLFMLYNWIEQYNNGDSK